EGYIEEALQNPFNGWRRCAFFRLSRIHSFQNSLILLQGTAHYRLNQCQQVEAKIIRLADGHFVPPETLDPAEFDQLQSALNDETGRKLSKEEDKAGLNRQEKFSLVYLVKKAGQLDKVILPIRGKGLWSTLYGYVALSADLYHQRHHFL
ncbi:MAG: hypothetical protein D3922_14835, partial [Candidatus Electrothrix sp. AR1]|nr:hypothetical protein [Candidatus Electrothrix sp. AR1]